MRFIQRKRRRGSALALGVALLTLTAPPVGADPAMRTTADVFIIDGGDVTGSSSLVRTSSGVSTSVRASQLPAGDATTLWWVIFNDPSKCHQPGECGENDIFDGQGGLDHEQIKEVGISALFATGHVVGDSGNGTYSDGLRVGEEREDPLNGPGLTNPRGAEIHLVVRTHGEADPEQVDEQISTFNAGCNPDCVNLQASMHRAP